MIDLEAIQDAVFAALDAGVPAELGGAHIHVLQDSKAPLNIIDEMDFEAQGSKSDPLDRVTFDVVSIHEGKDRAPLLRQARAVRDALDEAVLSVAGMAPMEIAFVGGTISGTAADGRTYVAISRFESFAQPA